LDPECLYGAGAFSSQARPALPNPTPTLSPASLIPRNFPISILAPASPPQKSPAAEKSPPPPLPSPLLAIAGASPLPLPSPQPLSKARVPSVCFLSVLCVKAFFLLLARPHKKIRATRFNPRRPLLIDSRSCCFSSLPTRSRFGFTRSASGEFPREAPLFGSFRDLGSVLSRPHL